MIGIDENMKSTLDYRYSSRQPRGVESEVIDYRATAEKCYISRMMLLSHDDTSIRQAASRLKAPLDHDAGPIVVR